MKTKAITKKYNFTSEESNKLQNVEIGLASAMATVDGLMMYKQAYLQQVYKRCGLDKEKQGITKKITYNLSKNEIIYTEEPVNKAMLAKK